jgi:hypothetical protein
MPEESLERRIEQLERIVQDNRWWRGGLIAALVFIGLVILLTAGRHRHRVDVVVKVPPWVLRTPHWGYGPGPYPPPPQGWGGGTGGGRPAPEVGPGRGPSPQAP